MKEFLGCSGFYYAHWARKFYPEDLPKEEWLSFYAQQFNSVEINSTFYQLPKRRTLQHWYDVTPKHFRITLKGSRYITHIRRLVHVKKALGNFYRLADTLNDKLGCILWQLPPNLHYNPERLSTFCAMLSTSHANVVEFRHPSWYVDKVNDVLHQQHITFCSVSAPNLPETIVKTTNTLYVRFHGKKSWYDYSYSNRELNTWSLHIKKQKPAMLYAYFNNDYNANAVDNCLSFAKIMRR